MQKCYQIRHYMDFPARFSEPRPGWEFKALCIPETHFAVLETGHKTFGILYMVLLDSRLHWTSLLSSASDLQVSRLFDKPGRRRFRGPHSEKYFPSCT